MAEFPISGWVHHVAFSPSGCGLAHDSSISFVDVNQVLIFSLSGSLASALLGVFVFDFEFDFFQDYTVAHMVW
ncbi:hypothetical protein Y032_0683g1501 [Ancylostoma ceylanicum]|nr:hypothetical protein Y032_0683g1501 [Ancylostoma ceylanicum]